MSTIVDETVTLPAKAARPELILHTVRSRPTSCTPKNRPTLVLLHFWGGSSRTFAGLVQHLGDRYNIVAPSLRGWGRSSRPSESEAYRIDHYADDIVDLLLREQKGNLDVRRNGVMLVGHSMGGKIAQVVLTRPEVTLELVKGIILIAPAPAGSLQLPEEMRQQQVQAYTDETTARAAIQNVLLASPDAVDNVELEALVSDAASGSAEAKSAWPSHGMSEDHEAEVAEAVKRWKPERLRALVVAGSLDVVERETEVRGRTAAMLEKAGADVVVEVLDSGHLVPVEAPKQLAEKMTAFIDAHHDMR